MSHLPLAMLVSRHAGLPGSQDAVADEAGVYTLALAQGQIAGVLQTCPSDEDMEDEESQGGPPDDHLLFFAPLPDPQPTPWGGHDPSIRKAVPPGLSSHDEEVAHDEIGSWYLFFGRAGTAPRLWVRVNASAVGHAEFASIVDRLQHRSRTWALLLAKRATAAPSLPTHTPPRCKDFDA